jgi:hypothetical protein
MNHPLFSQEIHMSIFTGFIFRTPTGYLNEREQEALIKYVLERVATQPATAHEVSLVIEGRQEARDLSAGTLSVLRALACDFITDGKPIHTPKRVMSRACFMAGGMG